MSADNSTKLIHQKVNPDFERTIAYLENLMIVVCDFKNGPMESPDPPHSHSHEQISYVAEGELIFFRGEEELQLKAGDIVTIPSGLPHCIKTISKHVRLIDSFNPIRKDFLE
jgi:quercetin dioxygenase-like cupin family protein